MKLVEFKRHQTPFAAGERAAFVPAVADRYERAGVGRVVGTVDDRGRILLDDLAGEPVEVEPDGETADGAPARPTPAQRGPRGGRQG